MNSNRILLFNVLLSIGCFCAPAAAFAYGAQGHETVGAIAEDLIQGTPAEAHVRQLLQGDTLANAATWADRVKGTNLDQEMKDYKTKNHAHHSYHFTDVPIQETTYRDGTVGTTNIDIVHILPQCIEVLRRNDTPATNPHGFSPRIALLLLAHFVGDIHQPLHVGAAYLNQKNRFVDPNLIHSEVEADEGGNFLKFKARSKLLHTYWDDDAVSHAMKKAGARTPQQYAAIIIASSPVVQQTPGPVQDWPKKWAEEILPIAAQAHRRLKAATPTQVHDFFGNHLQWPVTVPSSYDNAARDTVHERLTKAGFRLAQLLQAIWP
jgi:hypothetical protein